ncbi:hypothetical protein ACS0TY_027533 [Phlomoides rotata]
MEGSVRSGGVLKKKSSSGCLIIKKKVENRNSGGGWEDLSDTSKEKKRPRLVSGELGVSDDDESLGFMRRKANDKRLHNGYVGYRRSEVEDREYERSNVGIDIRSERKRSKLDLLDFDEYDEFNGKRTRDECLDDRFKMVGHRDDENLREFGVGSLHRNVALDKRHVPYFDGSSSGRSKGGEHGGLRNKGFELEEDEEDMPGSLLRLKYQERDEPIRLQGKNGVLKVMVNKKKRMEPHSLHKKYDHREVEERAGFGLGDVMKKEFSPSLPVYPDSKPPENRGLWVEKDKLEVKSEKVKPKLNKGIKISGVSKGIKVRELEIDGTDTALKLGPPGLQASSSSKKVVKKEEAQTPPENVTPVKGKEGKAKRGGSTEKQMLREKIREMLIDSGWSIDYRPRRNRDYLDAVYINPNGTAYWSIIKAYEALKKQLGEDISKSKLVVDSSSFAPLSEDLINKLTRQTKKKIEEEMKRKRKEDTSAKIAKRSAVQGAGESSDSDDVGSPKRKFKKIKLEKPTTVSNSNVILGRTSKVIGRCTLLVRGSDKVACDGYVPYSGKRTLLGWLIDSGTVQLSEKVKYMNRKRNRVMLEGWITKDGIHCGCCSKILTVSKFELHAGSKLRQPFQNIYLDSGPSLLQCQIDAWNRQGESVCQDFNTVAIDGDDPDDDTCGICGDGGSLICCDSCPSTFHQICLGIQMLPSGDWHCPNCTCKFCGDASGSAAEENDSTADELARCSFCEKKYHKSCSSEGIFALPMGSNGASFCGLKCQELYDHLQKILGVKNELEAGFSWSLIQRTDVSDTSHRGFPQRVESNSKLAVALSVMDECFMPILDRRSGFNMIRNVVYNIGSNFNRLNYCGFYTAILERGDEIVSAASIRIHGTRLAEMPFIGTRGIYRRQGMCRRLLSAIETELRSLKVEQLIIPAVLEHMNTWTTVFGFHQLENALKKERKSLNMLVFPGTDMLQKQLLKHFGGMKVSESVTNKSQLSVLVEKSDIDSSTEHDNCLTNQQKEPVASSNYTPIPSESNSNSNTKSELLNKLEAPCLKPVCDSSVETVIAAEANGNHNRFSEVSKDAGPVAIASNGEVNGEEMASSPTRVPDEDQIIRSALETEASADPDSKDKCDGQALCSKTNDEASLEKNVTERMNEKCNSVPGMPPLVDGEVSPRISQNNTSPPDNIKESSDTADENSR